MSRDITRREALKTTASAALGAGLMGALGTSAFAAGKGFKKAVVIGMATAKDEDLPWAAGQSPCAAPGYGDWRDALRAGYYRSLPGGPEE